MIRSSPVRAAVAFLGLFGAAALAETVEQKYEDGTVKLKYEVDAKGKKNGLFEEFYPSGKVKVRATYNSGMLDGKYATFFENGRVQVTAIYQTGKLHGPYSERTESGQPKLLASYVEGKLDGTVTRYEDGQPVFTHPFQKGEPVFARSAKEIRETLKKIAGPLRKGKDLPSQRDEALRRFQAYRYLAGVPYEEMALDDDLNRTAQAAAVACEKLKRLEHQLTKNPGMPEAEFKLAQKGAAGSNLGYGFARLAESVDYYIGDIHSEPLGHRRWTLYPYLTKVGFGRSGHYSAMFVLDRGSWAKDVPDFEFVSWPPPGYMPTTMMKPGDAWSCSLHPRKFQALDKEVKARIFSADAQLNKVGEPLPLNYHKPNNLAIGLPYCMIFRPQKISLAAGKRYLVEISGLKTADEKTRTISYPVVFMAAK